MKNNTIIIHKGIIEELIDDRFDKLQSELLGGLDLTEENEEQMNAIDDIVSNVAKDLKKALINGGMKITIPPKKKLTGVILNKDSYLLLNKKST